MKLTFESNLNYQQEAIKSITDLFEGQPLEDSILEFNLKEEDLYKIAEILDVEVKELLIERKAQ
jgi:type III restriction enzyme